MKEHKVIFFFLFFCFPTLIMSIEDDSDFVELKVINNSTENIQVIELYNEIQKAAVENTEFMDYLRTSPDKPKFQYIAKHLIKREELTRRIEKLLLNLDHTSLSLFESKFGLPPQEMINEFFLQTLGQFKDSFDLLFENINEDFIHIKSKKYLNVAPLKVVQFADNINHTLTIYFKMMLSTTGSLYKHKKVALLMDSGIYSELSNISQKFKIIEKSNLVIQTLKYIYSSGQQDNRFTEYYRNGNIAKLIELAVLKNKEQPDVYILQGVENLITVFEEYFPTETEQYSRHVESIKRKSSMKAVSESSEVPNYESRTKKIEKLQQFKENMSSIRDNAIKILQEKRSQQNKMNHSKTSSFSGSRVNRFEEMKSDNELRRRRWIEIQLKLDQLSERKGIKFKLQPFFNTDPELVEKYIQNIEEMGKSTLKEIKEVHFKKKSSEIIESLSGTKVVIDITKGAPVVDLSDFFARVKSTEEKNLLKAKSLSKSLGIEIKIADEELNQELVSKILRRLDSITPDSVPANLKGIQISKGETTTYREFPEVFNVYAGIDSTANSEIPSFGFRFKKYQEKSETCKNGAEKLLD